MLSVRDRFVMSAVSTLVFLGGSATAQQNARYHLRVLEPPSGGSLTRAFGLNDFAEVVGSVDISSTVHACVWLGTGNVYGLPAGPTDLTALAGLSGPGEAYEISDSGIVVGKQFNGSETHAYVWDLSVYPATGWTIDLGTLGGESSVAYSVSDTSPAVVVGSSLECVWL